MCLIFIREIFIEYDARFQLMDYAIANILSMSMITM